MLIAGQTNPIPGAAVDGPDTAAQNALQQAENLNNSLREIRTRINALGERLGVGNPPDPKAAARLARAGIIGAITESIETGQNIASETMDIVSRIEGQI